LGIELKFGDVMMRHKEGVDDRDVMMRGVSDVDMRVAGWNRSMM
jgi:hypothetical protein